MTGGISTPPVEAQASTPAAYAGRKPTRFMAGIDITPVVSTLVITLPDMEPIKPEAKIATFAGPPRRLPSSANARFRKNAPPPVYCSATPKTRKPTTMLAKAFIGMPSRLSVPKMWNPAVTAADTACPLRTPGARCETIG